MMLIMIVRLFVYIMGPALFATTLKAQDAHAPVFGKEISFTTENDAYLLQKKDAYYTNGVFFSFSKADEKKQNKRVKNYQLGQMIFTPISKKATPLSEIDRPYCGLLFLKYAETRFQKNGSVFQFNIAATQLGPASWGEGLQNSYHKLFGYSRFNGWQYQVQNALGADIGAAYAQTVLQDSSWCKLVPQAAVNLGTTYTNASLGTYIVIGSFEKNNSSTLWNAGVSVASEKRNRKAEVFVYWYPQIIYQVYNGTVQGGLLNKGSGAVLGTPEKWMYQQSIGFCYSARKWAIKVAWIYQTKEAVSQSRDQEYVSFTTSFRLH